VSRRQSQEETTPEASSYHSQRTRLHRHVHTFYARRACHRAGTMDDRSWCRQGRSSLLLMRPSSVADLGGLLYLLDAFYNQAKI